MEMSHDVDHYDALGLVREASQADVKRAYRSKALEWHPDKNLDRLQLAEVMFKRVARAYEVLSDPLLRSQYDAQTLNETLLGGRSSAEVFSSFFGDATNDEAQDPTPGNYATTSLALQVVGPEQVFNLPLFEVYLLIDCRPAVEFEQAHIVTSINVDVDAALATGTGGVYSVLVTQLQAMTELVGHPDQLGTIVIVDIDGNLQRSSQVCTAFQELLADDSADFQGISNFVERLRSRLQRVWTIRSGFQGFATVFPALCGPSLSGEDQPKWVLTGITNGETMNPTPLELSLEPMPHYIMAGVFLGSRAVPHTVASLSRFGITHCLVDKTFGQQHTSQWSHLRGPLAPQRVGSIVYQEVVVPEELVSQNINMQLIWESGAAFIDSALACNGVVMVQVHGRSRSASFVLAWLMRRLHIPAAIAARMLREICPAIDWRLVCLDQIPAERAQEAPLMDSSAFVSMEVET